MAILPEYRVRLFLSADIVGSTAFKAGNGRTLGEDQTTPMWVSVTRDLYRKFAEDFTKNFSLLERKIDPDGSSYACPSLWKTVGDEVIFCCRLVNLEHLSFCITSFIATVHSYSDGLKVIDSDLAIKANAWTATFPSVNVLVPLLKTTSSQQEGIADETIEFRADGSPQEFDFLGTDIDAGFRLASHSAENRFSISCGLALLICNAAYHKICHVDFNYHNRQQLKGVIGGRPYPIITINMERNVRKIAIRDYEHAITNATAIKPVHLANFLRAFMEDEGIDVPQLYVNKSERDKTEFPDHYVIYKKGWETILKGNIKNDTNFENSFSTSNDKSPDSDSAKAEESLDDLFKDYNSKLLDSQPFVSGGSFDLTRKMFRDFMIKTTTPSTSPPPVPPPSLPACAPSPDTEGSPTPGSSTP